MSTGVGSIRRWLLSAGLGLALLGLLGLLLACGGQPQKESPASLGSPSAPPRAPAAIQATPTRATDTTPAAVPSAAPLPLKLLKTSPEKGPAGTQFTVTGTGLPPGKPIEFTWVTVDGSYVMDAGPENVLFYERKFVERRVPLGQVTTDAQGSVSATFTALEDYGEVHDIYARADGVDIAKGGFRILRTATITPTQGPVGTPITMTIKGMGWKPFENTMALRYDNKYTGFVSAVTTRGTAKAVIRAAGPVGQHIIQVTGASAAAPYLNMQQSPVAFIPDFRWTFTVTKDAGPPPDALDWPDSSRAAPSSVAVPRTTAGSAPSLPDLSVALEPASGPILSQTTLRASGLSPNTETELFWVTARGNRISPSGWSLSDTSIQKATQARDGSLTATIQVPDDLGGWHVVKLVQGGKVLAEVPYFTERSLVGVSPKRVKAGETFTVQIKGIGWTELDNGVAVTYDNAYIGYACGFNSNGDITFSFLVATGGPGTHLIDLYPMLYRAKGKHPPEYWNFQLPHLTALQDHPGLALGYKLPVFRLAIEVVP